jgi:hypothetical protein
MSKGTSVMLQFRLAIIMLAFGLISPQVLFNDVTATSAPGFSWIVWDKEGEMGNLGCQITRCKSQICKSTGCLTNYMSTSKNYGFHLTGSSRLFNARQANSCSGLVCDLLVAGGIRTLTRERNLIRDYLITTPNNLILLLKDLRDHQSFISMLVQWRTSYTNKDQTLNLLHC